MKKIARNRENNNMTNYCTKKKKDKNRVFGTYIHWE